MNVKSKTAKSIFPCHPTPTQVVSGGRSLKKSGERSIHTVWHGACWRQLIVSNCFQMPPTLNSCIFWPWLVILLVNLGASHYFYVSQATTQIHPWWASELLGPLGAFVFCCVVRNLSTSTANISRIHNLRKNPQFPTVPMLFNKQFVYAKNTSLKEHWIFVISRNFFFGKLIVKITCET